MNAAERSEWVMRAAKYVRLCAESVESIVITTSDGDTVTFKKRDQTDEVDNEIV